MPELRRDPVVGYWTIVSTERGWRPFEYKPKRVLDERPCPFCEGRESQTTGEVYAIRKEGSAADGPGWQVRVILSKMPLLSRDKETIERYGQGIYDLMDGVGEHEVIIESPQHCHDLDELSIDAIEKVVQAYVHRFNDLAKDPRMKYSLLFKNHGLVSGSARDVIRHSRSQLIAMPITPKRVKEELAASREYFQRRERCVFCDILKQETSDGSRLVMQNASFFAFCPFASRAPFEMWIMPKRHSADFGALPRENFRDFAEALKQCLSKLRALLDDPPFSFILHTAPYRHQKQTAQWKTIEEDYHWYLQISPRLSHQAGFEWGSGVHINPTPPEDAALLLRETP